MYKNEIRDQLNEAKKVLESFIDDDNNIATIERAARVIADSIKKGGKVFS